MLELWQTSFRINVNILSTADIKIIYAIILAIAQGAMLARSLEYGLLAEDVPDHLELSRQSRMGIKIKGDI